MTRTKHHKVTLREQRSEDGEVNLLEAYLDGEGNLVLGGYDLGDSAERFWGDSDSAFSEWLESRGIESRFDSWV